MQETSKSDLEEKPSQKGRVLVMTAGGINPQIMINALAGRFPNICIILEQPETKTEIVRRRARHLGWFNAIGQLGTMVASRLFKNLAARRSAEIIRLFEASAEQNETIPVTRVRSLNGEDCHRAIRDINPDVVFTISCRILKQATLAAIPCPIINFHAGINPHYRGQMGGYWSLVENDRKNFGSTMHLVDKGVDTGGTLYEQRLTPGKTDTIATYPLLLTAGSTGIAIKATEDALDGRLAPSIPQGISTLRFPPTLWTWVRHGITRGIW